MFIWIFVLGGGGEGGGIIGLVIFMKEDVKIKVIFEGVEFKLVDLKGIVL